VAWLELGLFNLHGSCGQRMDFHFFRIGARLLQMEQFVRSRETEKSKATRETRETRKVVVHDAVTQTVIHNPEAAALLFQTKSLELLGVLVEQERSLQEMSDLLAWPLNTCKYQLERLCAVQLVHCTRKEPRAGRPIRYYQATDHTYFVPYVLTPAITPAILLEQEYLPKTKRFVENISRAALEARVARDGFHWGVRFSQVNGKMRQRAALEEVERWDFLAPHDPPLIDVWNEDLTLAPEDAKALQLELCALINHYRSKAGPRSYTLRLGLTPNVNNG
jgi:hypothetical protein